MEEEDEIDFAIIDLMDQSGFEGVNDFLDNLIKNLTL